MRHSSCSAFPCLLLSSLLSLVLSGCAMGTSGPPSPEAGAAITGRVVGGQAPIIGANVYLFAANTTGYGGSGIAASSSNKSVSLLTSVQGSTAQDVNPSDPTYLDYYVTTSGVTVSCPSGGCFSISSDYTCTPGTQVYLYSLGGSQGGVANPVAGLLAALGSCPSGGSFVTVTPFVVVNEVSTIAAAYAFAGFATDALHVSSSGTALAQTGIANAFANAANLAGIATGAALATTPAGNGTVPQNEINTLANILASCVNTNGAVTGPASATTCYTLFNDALSGGSSGALPGDTATAAINMAHNPGANITGLYGLSTGSPPFAPALSMQPNDFTVALSFAGGGLYDSSGIAIDGLGNVWVANPQTASSVNGGDGSVTELSSLGVPFSGSPYIGGGLDTDTGMTAMDDIAIDGSGDAWIANDSGNSITELSSSGSPISGSPYTGGGLGNPTAIAIDGFGSVWAVDYSDNAVSKFSSGGTALSGAEGYTGNTLLTSSFSIAIDGSGAVWVPSSLDSFIAKFSTTGVAISPVGGYTGGGVDHPFAIALDSFGNVWIADPGGHRITKLSNSGSAISTSSGYTGGGLVSPGAIAIDGAGDVWTANLAGGIISEFSSSGLAISPSTGYFFGGLSSVTAAIAIDGSGNVWATDIGGNVAEFIGIGTPVITPIVGGLPATPTTDGSSNLGTRP